MNGIRRCAALALLILAGNFHSAFLATAQKPAAASKPAASTPAAAAAAPMDINTASADQLKTLPGIGDAYSKRIVAGRPYTAKNQLVGRGVIPQATYDKVQTLIIAKRLPK